MFDTEGVRPAAAGDSGDRTGAPIIGLEHEFYLSRDGDRVDFRRIIDDLELPGRRIDPADKRAYRLFSGHVITCDDEEAEYAIAPVALRSGFAQLVDRACVA